MVRGRQKDEARRGHEIKESEQIYLEKYVSMYLKGAGVRFELKQIHNPHYKVTCCAKMAQ